ncbi:Diacylglycerol acyltransferase [Artemisia annua]|uniref:Diacylglycerol acyltransferase n=1 Tax=Artemisia annua TaxID=35608 RepID=A0A2U1KA70_ARTAN|nr:Diacylglycerol acyltransferase [Artemisia annua]
MAEEGFDLVTAIKGAGLYRRTKHTDYVSDFLPPTPHLEPRLYLLVLLAKMILLKLRIKTYTVRECYQNFQDDTITYSESRLKHKRKMRKRENAEELYSQVKSEVEKCLAYCIRRREEDPCIQEYHCAVHVPSYSWWF